MGIKKILSTSNQKFQTVYLLAVRFYSFIPKQNKIIIGLKAYLWYHTLKN